MCDLTLVLCIYTLYIVILNYVMKACWVHMNYNSTFLQPSVLVCTKFVVLIN
jgi:hypothetical protein